MNESFAIRLATPVDAAQVALHRRLMFEAVRDYDPAALDAMEEKYRVWVEDKLAKGEYRGWFALNSDQAIVAGAGLWLREWLLSPVNLTGQDGHILDVYVRPDYRRQGIARQLMETLLAWGKDNGVTSLSLDSSVAGLRLYESLGFTIYPRRMLMTLPEAE